MAATIGACPIPAKGLGVACARGNPTKVLYSGVVAVPGFQFDTYDDFIDEDKVLEAIANQELFPLVKFSDLEDASVEESTVETGLGDVFTTRDSRRGFMAYMDMNLKQNELFQDYGSTEWGYFSIDDAGNWEGQTPDGTVVKGYTLSKFDPKPMSRSLSVDTYSRTPVEIRFDNNDEMDKQIVLALAEDLDWQAKTLPDSALTYATADNGSVAANVVTVSFNIVNDRLAPKKSVAVRTVTAAELTVINQAGTVCTPDSVTETTTPGTYDIDCTSDTFTSGTVELKATATSLYYSNELAVT